MRCLYTVINLRSQTRYCTMYKSNQNSHNSFQYAICCVHAHTHTDTVEYAHTTLYNCCTTTTHLIVSTR